MIAKLYQKVSESIYAMSLEYLRASTRHLVTGVLIFARTCDPVCMRY